MKKIGVLTSGGDAPGMNAAIRAVVKTAIANGIQPIGFIKGYNGILEKNYHVMDRESVSGIIHSGGTILKTARCMEIRCIYQSCTTLQNDLQQVLALELTDMKIPQSNLHLTFCHLKRVQE